MLGKCNLNPEDCVYGDEPDAFVASGSLYTVGDDGRVRLGEQDLGRLRSETLGRKPDDLEGTLWGL